MTVINNLCITITFVVIVLALFFFSFQNTWWIFHQNMLFHIGFVDYMNYWFNTVSGQSWLHVVSWNKIHSKPVGPILALLKRYTQRHLNWYIYKDCKFSSSSSNFFLLQKQHLCFDFKLPLFNSNAIQFRSQHVTLKLFQLSLSPFLLMP